MPAIRQQSAAAFRVEIDGTPLPDDVHALMSYAVVEDNLNLPDSFLLSFLDPGRAVIAKTGVQVASEVKVSVTSEADPAGEPVFSGEVTALEVEFEGGRTRTVVRGFDKANRLYRGRRTRAFKDVKYSDVVKQVATEAGLEVGQVDTPPGQPLRHLSQANTTDAELLAALAGEVGYVVLVQDGKVHFHAPTRSSTAPSAGDLEAQDPLQLTHGDNLLRYRAVLTADAQVKEVSVRGWSIADKRELVATVPSTSTSAEVGVSPGELAAAFDDRSFVATDVPYGEQGLVDAAATALAEQIAGSHAQLEGVARGNPKLRAGSAVSLGLAGEPFDGKYTLTMARHVFDNGEYTTQFASTGRLERSLQSLTSGGGAGVTTSPAFVRSPIPGVVSAIVTNVKDTDGMAQAKVKVPRLDDTFESDWLRVVQPGAGADRGAVILPEVDDEVVVAFEHGDLRRGYVLGGVYNGKDKPSAAAHDGAVGSDGRVERRSFTSRKGHFLLISDADGDEFVQAATKDAAYSLVLAKDTDGGAVLVASDNVVKVDAKGDVTITSKGKVRIEAADELTLKGRKVKVTADTDVELSGMNVKVTGSASAELSAARTKVGASASLDLDGGAAASLRGGIVKIN